MDQLDPSDKDSKNKNKGRRKKKVDGDSQVQGSKYVMPPKIKFN